MKILTQNIRSYNPSSKRRKKSDKFKHIEMLLKDERPDIAVLTETRHYKDEAFETNLSKPYIILAEHAGANNQQNRHAGVIIIAKENWQIQGREIMYSQEGGRYIIVNIKDTDSITLVGIYGHSGTDNISNITMRNLERDLAIFEEMHGIHPMVIVGDFNAADNLEDTTSSIIKTRTVETIERIKKQRNLVDMATRTGNHEHTFHTPGQRVYCSSRIDKILTNMATLTNLSIKEWITDHKTLIASTSNKSTKGNITIQDYIIKTKLFKEWAVQSINRTIYAKSINKERLKTQNGEIREDIDQVAQMNEGDYFNILTEAASLIRQKHKKEIIKSGLKERELISKQQKTISIARRRLRGEVDAERITTLKNWINEATDKIKNHYQRKLELKDTRVKSFYRNKNGKINNTTFRELKEPRRTNRISEILTEDGARIRDNEGIHRIFEEKYRTATTSQMVREATLEDYLGDNAMDVIEADRQINEPFNHDEIKRTLRKTKTRTAPGHSGDTISMYRLIYAIMPNMMLKGINEFYGNKDMQDDQQYEWIKDKKVIYIPKPGRAKNSIKGYRPLSMCETLYKIISKTATHRINLSLESSIDIDQSGFVPGRSTHHAITVALNTIAEAELETKPLQIVAIDLESAFDTMEPLIAKEAMHAIGFHEEYTNKYHEFTTGGKVNIQVNGILGEKFTPTKGIGQGDPASAPKFILGHEPFNRMIKKENKNWKYKNNLDEHIQPTKYADDHLWYLNMQTEEDIEELFDMYKRYEKASGLRINKNKTEIICINTNEELERKLAAKYNVVEHMRYLGVYLAKNVNKSVDTTINKTMEKIKIKNSALRQKRHNLIKKRNLMKIGITTTINHVFQAMPLTEKQIDKLEKERNKAFWSREENAIQTQGRVKVSKHRINGPIEIGGLNLTSLGCIYRSLSTSSGINILNRIIFGDNRQNDTLAITIKDAMIQSNMCSIEDLITKGSAEWDKAAQKLTKRTPIIAVAMKTISKKLKIAEKDNNLWHLGAIKGNINESIFKITDETSSKLENNNIKTVGQLFLTHPNLTIDTSRPKDIMQLIGERVNQPLANLIRNLQRMTMQYSNQGANIQKDGTLGWLWIRSSHKFNKEEKMAEIEEIKKKFPVAPSYKTRLLTNEIVTKEEYAQGYKNILKAQTTTYNQSLALEILNRTVWTNKKANQSNMKDINNIIVDEACSKCGEAENTEHMILECSYYSEKIWSCFQQLLNKAQRRLHIKEQAKRVNPEILEENINYDQNLGSPTTTINYKNILYNIPLKNTSKAHKQQIESIIYQIRAKIYSTRNNEYEIEYNEARIRLHLLNVVKLVKEDRKSARIAINLVEELENVIIRELQET